MWGGRCVLPTDLADRLDEQFGVRRSQLDHDAGHRIDPGHRHRRVEHYSGVGHYVDDGYRWDHHNRVFEQLHIQLEFHQHFH